jgi:rubredoxin
MLKISKFVKSQWHDIKGNAKWDFIKWGAIVVITLLVATIRFLQNAPIWQVIIALIVTCACVYFLIPAVQKFTKTCSQLQDEPLQKQSSITVQSPNSIKDTENLHRCSNCGYRFEVENPYFSTSTSAGSKSPICPQCGNKDHVWF